jgi:hypothetical protein
MLKTRSIEKKLNKVQEVSGVEAKTEVLQLSDAVQVETDTEL